jgi:carbon-monoxide dehydrogenase large subunit
LGLGSEVSVSEDNNGRGKINRLEDPDLMRGAGRFIDDISRPGMLESAFVRSPFGHAAIGGIDKSAALALPGVHAVLTRVDLMPYLRNEYLVVGLPSKLYKQNRNRPALAGDEVVHVGEAVAIVVADNRYIAEDAAMLVEVDYEPLPAMADCRDALAPGAALVHRDGPDNLLSEFDIGYGDVDGAFASAPHVFKESLWQHRGGSHSMECRGGIADYDTSEDFLTYWCSTQTPHAARRTLVDMLGRDDDSIRVVTPDIGGGFGPKLVFYPEDVTLCLASMILGCPVKWIEDRREHFVATTQERDQYWEIEVAADSDGKLLGIRGGIIHDHGAYTGRGINLAANSAETLTMGYIVPTCMMNVKVALTNKVPATPVRGAGHPQAAFAMERLLDRVARELDLDRAEVRRRNFIPPDAMPYEKQVHARSGLPVVIDTGEYEIMQQKVLDRAGWVKFAARQSAARDEGRYLGIGLGNYVKGTGRGPFEAVTVRIGSSGRIFVACGGTAIGQGTRTMLTRIVAEQLGGDPSNVVVTVGDTAVISNGIGTSNSRLTVTAGSSAHVAAIAVRKKVLTVAADMLEAAEADLEIEGGEIKVRGSDLKVHLGDVAKAVAGTPGYRLPDGVTPGMEATESHIIEEETFASGCAVAEVEVDIETGKVTILNYVMAQDSGRILDRQIAEGQLYGGIAHGIGNTLFEWMRYDADAQPVTATLAEYLLVTAPEVPRVELILHETPTTRNPLGVKGIGECGLMPATSAIVSAIEDALSPFGAHLTRVPLTPPDILAAILVGKG